MSRVDIDADDSELLRVFGLLREHHEALRDGALAAIERAQREADRWTESLEEISRAEALLSSDQQPTPSDGELKPRGDGPPPGQPSSQAPAGASPPQSSPPASKIPPGVSARRDVVAQVVNEASNPLKKADIVGRLRARGYPDVSAQSVTGDLSALFHAERIERMGRRGGTRYQALPEPEATPAPELETGISIGEDGTPEGRILEYVTLNAGQAISRVALGVGYGVEDTRRYMSRLIREGLVRANHRGGTTVYTGTP